jgi:hypothetical protein
MMSLTSIRKIHEPTTIPTVLKPKVNIYSQYVNSLQVL